MPREGIIEGVATDKDGNPMGGALVTALNQETLESHQTTTNSNGEFSFDLPGGGTFHVIGRKDDGTNTLTGITKANVVVESALPDSVVSRPNDDNTKNFSGMIGFEIETKTEWPSIGARLSNNSSGFTTAYLQDSNGNNIKTVDISNLTAGDAFIFDNVDLTSNTSFLMLIDADGASWTGGFGSTTDTGFAYTTTDIDITAGYFDGSLGTGTDGGGLIEIGNVGFN